MSNRILLAIWKVLLLTIEPLDFIERWVGQAAVVIGFLILVGLLVASGGIGLVIPVPSKEVIFENANGQTFSQFVDAPRWPFVVGIPSVTALIFVFIAAVRLQLRMNEVMKLPEHQSESFQKRIDDLEAELKTERDRHPRIEVTPAKEGNKAVLFVRNIGTGQGIFSASGIAKTADTQLRTYTVAWEDQAVARMPITGGGGRAKLIVASVSTDEPANELARIGQGIGRFFGIDSFGHLEIREVTQAGPQPYIVNRWSQVPESVKHPINPKPIVITIQITSEPALKEMYIRTFRLQGAPVAILEVFEETPI